MHSRQRELEATLIQARSAVEALAALLELAELHAAGQRNREGLRCAREALNIARVRGDARSAARALAAAARCHYQRGDYVAAAAAGLDAVEAFDDIDLAGRAAALASVAQSLMAVDCLEFAEQLAARSAADAAKARNPAAEAAAHALWGAILTQRDRYGAGREKLRQAGAIQRRLGDTPTLKRTIVSIADGYRDQALEALAEGGLERARLLWRHAIRVYRVAIATGNVPADDALAWAAVAECELRLDEREAALTAAQHAVALAVDAGSPRVRARCHLWESHALKALGRLEAARRACENARVAAEQLEHDPILAECLKAEASLLDLAGRFESAHDLESRAEQVLLERSAFFARVRDDLKGLFARDRSPPPAMHHAAA